MNFLTATLTTPADARAYLAALVSAGCAYHIEDDAGDIVRPDGSPLFAPIQAALANLRAAECATLLEDPCADLLDLVNA